MRISLCGAIAPGPTASTEVAIIDQHETSVMIFLRIIILLYLSV
jgi:hypothetical protein